MCRKIKGLRIIEVIRMGGARPGKQTSGRKNVKQAFEYEYIFLFLTCALIFFPLFFRGLFFARELRVVHIITFSLLTLWFIFRYRDRDCRLLQYRYEYFLLGLVAVYFMTVPFAACREDALAEGLKYANYMAVYILVRDLIDKDKRNTQVFLNTIIAGVSVVSFVGLMNYLGFMNNNGALAGTRIGSTIQYPNTLAAIIGAAVFMTASLMPDAGRKLKLLYIAVLNILFITFVLTFSRTMWLMLPFVMVIYFFTIPRERKLEGLALTLITALPSLAAAGLLTGHMGDKSFVSVLIILASILVSTVLGLASERLRPVALSNRVLGIIVAVIILVSVAAGAAVLNITEPIELSHLDMEDGYISAAKHIYSIEGEGDYVLKLDVKTDRVESKPWLGRVSVYSVDRGYKSTPLKHYYIREPLDGALEVPFSSGPGTYYITVAFYNYYKDTSFTVRDAKLADMSSGRVLEDIKLGYRYLPDALSARIESINIKSNSMQARITFFRDAFSLIRDNFVLGLGGRGWKAAYMAYRSSEYWTTETHSYPVQVWIETGTIGFLTAVGCLAAFAATALRRWKGMGGEKDRIRFAGVVFFMAAILLHSLVDFDLTMGSVSILLWASIALSSGWFEGKELKKRQPRYVKGLSAGCALVLLAVSISITAAAGLNYKTALAVGGNDMTGAEKYIRRAIRLDPFHTDYRTNLARIITAREDLEVREQYRQAGEQLEKALANDRFNHMLYGEMALHQYRYGVFDRAVQYLDRAIDVNPAVSEMYSQKMDFLLNVSRYYFDKKDRDKAVGFLGEIKKVEKQIAENNKKLARPVEVGPELMEQIYKTNFILEHIDDRHAFDYAGSVAMYDTFDFDSDGDRMPDLWQIPYQDDKAITGSLAEENGARALRLSSDNAAFYIQRLHLSLQPSARYMVMVEAKGQAGDGRMTVLVGSSSGKGQQFREGNIELDKEYTVYQDAFETSDDIQPGNQYIRLYFSDRGKEIAVRKVAVIRIK